MPVHPYDDQVIFLQDDKYNNFKLEVGMHAGTHIDSPMHLINRKTFINEISLNRFIGNGCLFDVRKERIIKYKDKYADVVYENDIVLLFTGHDKKYRTDG